MSAAAAWALAGALWAGCLAPGSWQAAVGGAGLLIVAVAPRRERLRLVLAAGALVLLGSGLAGARAGMAGQARLAELASAGGRAEIIGAVVTEPRESRHGAWAVLRVESIDGTSVRERAAVRLPAEPLPELGVRMRALVTARPLEDDGFDGHLRRLHAVAMLSPVTAPVVEEPAGELWRLTSALRERTRQVARGRLDTDRAALLTGLLTGDVRGQTPERKDVLAAAGLTHLVVVSGRHVGLLLAGVIGVAAVAGAGARARHLTGLAMLVFYVLLVRWEPSVLRAAVMASLVLGAGLAGRRAEARHSLAIAVLLLLLLDPMLAGHLGFGLSVSATAGVLVVTPWLAPRLPGPRTLRLAAAATMGAQAGAAPLLLGLDGGLSAGSIPANILAVPLAGAAQLVGLVAVIVGLPWPAAGSAVAALAGPPLSALLVVAEWAADAPALSAELLLTPAALAGLALVLAAASRRRAPRAAAALAVAAIVGLAVPALLPRAPVDALTITMIDVGQGDAVLVEAPSDGPRPARMLVDGGPEPEPLLAALRERDIDALDAVVLTHPHEDHRGGLPAVLQRIPVGALLIGPEPEPDQVEPGAAGLELAATQRGVPTQRVSAGRSLRLGSATVRVLWPPARLPAATETNDTSVVLHVSDGHGSALLTGDAEEQAQLRLLARPEVLSADVLKVPHHGGDTNAEGFIAAVDAAAALIGVGEENPYGHPSTAVLRELARTRVHRTDHHGTVSLQHPGQHHPAHDEHVAACHQDDEPERHLAERAERQIDPDQQRLVGERVEIGAELGRGVQSLGQEAVDRIADACKHEKPEREHEIAGYDQIDHDRHQQQAADGDEIGEVQHVLGPSDQAPGVRLTVRWELAEAHAKLKSIPPRTATGLSESTKHRNAGRTVEACLSAMHGFG